MSNGIVGQDCGSGACLDCYIVSKFTLRSVFRNGESNPAVIYKVEDLGDSCKFPSGTVTASNQSSNTPLVYQIERAGGEIESLVVAPHSEAAIFATSIVKVTAYTFKGSLVGGRFYFDLIQPI